MAGHFNAWPTFILIMNLTLFFILVNLIFGDTLNSDKIHLYFLTSDTCIPCRKTEELLTKNEEIRALIQNNFVFEKLTYPNPKFDSIKERYGKEYTPYMIFVDAEGQLLNKFFPTAQVDVLRWQLNRVISGHSLPKLKHALQVDSSITNKAEFLVARMDQCWYDNDEIQAFVSQLSPEDYKIPSVQYFLYRVLFYYNIDQPSFWFYDPVPQYFFENYNALHHLFPEHQLAKKLKGLWMFTCFKFLENGNDEEFKALVDIDKPWRLDTLMVYSVQNPAQIPFYGHFGAFTREGLWTSYYLNHQDTLTVDSILSEMKGVILENQHWDVLSLWYELSTIFGTNNYKRRWALENLADFYHRDPTDFETVKLYFDALTYNKEFEIAKRVFKKFKRIAENNLENEWLIDRMKKKLKKAKKQ